MIVTISDESFRLMSKCIPNVGSNRTLIVEYLRITKKGIFVNTREQKLIFFPIRLVVHVHVYVIYQ